MTIWAWVVFGLCAALIACLAAAVIAASWSDPLVTVLSVLIGVALCAACFLGIHWYMTHTASGQRAYKTQQSTLNGGLERTVTVYSYDGDVLGEWTGKFDVSENDQETFFDIDGRRVIIQGGIIINEEGSE